MEKRNPLEMFRGAKTPKIVKEADDKRQYKEADLHLKFCKWVKTNYPQDQFIRHEREKSRSAYMQNLMHCYNSDNDSMPDFELLEPSGKSEFMQQYGETFHYWHRLYIEFKAPGTILTLKDGITIKPAYADQYRRHLQFFLQNSPAYFCSDFELAKQLYIAYKAGCPLPKQEFRMSVDKVDVEADLFFENK